MNGRNSKGYKDPTAETAIENVGRQMQGLRSRVAGEHFERMIELSLNWYRATGRAHVEKTPEPMKPLGKPNGHGQFVACYTKAGQPDFKGTLAGGRGVVFEAKHTDNDRIDYSRVTGDQNDSLTLHDRLGAVAFVLVSFGLERFYRIPWKVWANMKELYGRKYITQEECDPYRVQCLSGVIKLLDGIEE